MSRSVARACLGIRTGAVAARADLLPVEADAVAAVATGEDILWDLVRSSADGAARAIGPVARSAVAAIRGGEGHAAGRG